MRVLISAGEPSGVLLGRLLGQAIERVEPGVKLDWLHPGPRSVLGFAEGLLAAPALGRALSGAVRHARLHRPDLLVLVAYSGFNLPFGQHCRRLGVSTLYLSPPQVWAWGRARTAALRRAADAVVCLFSFEEPLLRAAGVNAVYLGYPLLDWVVEQLATEPAHAAGRTRYIAFLPGSRPAERAFHVPLFERAFVLLRQTDPGVSGLIALPPGESAGAGLVAVGEHRYALMRDAACSALASGTVTLEAAVAGVPMAAVYHLSPVSRAIARLLVRTRHFALPNIIAGRPVVPEMLDPTAAQLAGCLSGLLQGRERAATMRGDLAEVRRRLGPGGCLDRAAALALDLARRPRC